MKNFAEYLENHNYSPRTIKLYSDCIARFEDWRSTDGLPYELLSYSDLLAFVKSLTHYSSIYQNQHLAALRQYFAYLQHSQRISQNPANGLHIRKTKRRAPHNLLKLDQLEALYDHYPNKTPSDQQKKLMLSLIIYQAIRREELAILTTEQLELRQGRIRIPQSRRANARTLKLQAHQVLDFHSFLTETRPQLEKAHTAPSNSLFLSPAGGSHLNNSLAGLLRQLKRQDAAVVSLRQLRQSVIREWLLAGELREVQYRAGHKHVSSTERYRFAELEALQKKLDQFHPLG